MGTCGEGIGGGWPVRQNEGMVCVGPYPVVVL